MITICDTARETARAQLAADKAARAAKRQAFLDTLFKPEDYHLNEDGTYTICGWRWELWAGEGDAGPHMTLNTWKPEGFSRPAPNLYRGIALSTQSVNSLESLGKALLDIDEHIADIDYVYPHTWWGRFRLWMATH